MSEWISVGDKLPEENRTVVVSCAECGATYRWEPMTARLYDGHWVDFNDDDIEYQLGVTVTHWLPIAVPPEG